MTVNSIPQEVTDYINSIATQQSDRDIMGQHYILAREAAKGANSLSRPLVIDFTTDTSYVYRGYAAIGTATSAAAWLISKTPVAGGRTTYAAVTNGLPSSTQIWDNRTSLTYS